MIWSPGRHAHVKQRLARLCNGGLSDQAWRDEAVSLGSIHLADALSEIERLQANVAALDRALDEERQTFPAEGVFLVTGQGRSYQRIAKLGEIPEPVTFAAIARWQDAIAGAIVKVRSTIEVHGEPPDAVLRWTDPSAHDYASAIVKAVYAAQRGEHEGEPSLALRTKGQGRDDQAG